MRTPPEQLAQDYRRGILPPKLQADLKHFLRVYGHRGAEIDLGLPRWSEDPTYILGLGELPRLDDPMLAPDVQFRRAARQAEEMVADSHPSRQAQAASAGRWSGSAAAGSRHGGPAGDAQVLHHLALRASPGTAVAGGRGAGEAGRLESAEDIFFVTMPEARAALAARISVPSSANVGPATSTS